MNKQKSRAIIHFSTILILLLMTALFLNKMVFSNLILARGDTFLYFYPYWNAAADALRMGRIPLWNPNIFMGAPLLANSQMGFFYPLNWPVWLLFETPYAINASILLHVLIAGIGSYLAGLHVMRLGYSAAFVTAVVFSLGGYLTAQVEHINQLQGLAWLPWMLLVVGTGQPKKRYDWLKSMILLALFFALQLLAGHAQTAFISGIALLIWIISQFIGRRFTTRQENNEELLRAKTLLAALAALIFAGLMALLLAAIQLLPTMELTGLSSRRGGLTVNEVLSFSLHPLHLTRTLLPAYPQSLFSEYIAFLPLLVLAMAFIGAWQWRKRDGVLPALVWIIGAFFLALGAYNPVNWLMVQLPGFNLFRVPARWLVLYALGVALLAGTGWQIVLDQIRARNISEGQGLNGSTTRETVFKPLLFFLIGVVILVVWAFLAGFLVEFIPAGMEAPYEAPSLGTVSAWGAELLFLGLVLFYLSQKYWKIKPNLLIGLFLAAVVLALFAASRGLPYNNLTTPEAFFDLRPPINRLMSEAAGPPTRFVSLSDIFFDPGDQPELDSIYSDQLTEAAQYDYTIAVKQKEVLSPNLPMLYGLSSVDGFDGGVLPLQSYSDQMQLILPKGVNTTDGRLREHLDQVPEARWLDLYNTKFIVTDKVGDIWQDDVFFDRQHPVNLIYGQELTVGFVPEFEATELRLLAAQEPALVTITTAKDQTWELVPEHVSGALYIARFPQAAEPVEIRVAGCHIGSSECELSALTLVDERDGAFQPLVPGQYRLIHSGDVKIYQNLDVMPRAYFVTKWRWAEDSDSAIEQMSAPEYDFRNEVILLSQDDEVPPLSQTDSDPAPSRVQIKEYLPERVVIMTDQGRDGMLILSDAHYPGWVARIDGRPAQIYQANNLFRAVYVPAGPHEIIFAFEPLSKVAGLWLTVGGLFILIVIVGYLFLIRRNQNA